MKGGEQGARGPATGQLRQIRLGREPGDARRSPSPRHLEGGSLQGHLPRTADGEANAVEQVAPVHHPEGKEIHSDRQRELLPALPHCRPHLGRNEPAERSSRHGADRRRHETRADPELSMLSGAQDEHRPFADAPGDPPVADCSCAYQRQKRNHDGKHQGKPHQSGAEHGRSISHREEIAPSPPPRWDRSPSGEGSPEGSLPLRRSLTPEQGGHPGGCGSHERSEDESGNDRGDCQGSFDRRTNVFAAATSFDIAGKETRHNELRERPRGSGESEKATLQIPSAETPARIAIAALVPRSRSQFTIPTAWNCSPNLRRGCIRAHDRDGTPAPMEPRTEGPWCLSTRERQSHSPGPTRPNPR